jgi:dihydrofolate synthase/folylpolyglutamate synthase
VTYEEALAWLYGLGRSDDSARTRGLARMRELMSGLGDPQNRFKAVHIAGTKGKGSSSAMLESCLRACNVRTGLFTSPHLHTFRERVRVNGQLISREDVARHATRVRAAMEVLGGSTTFEAITAIAFMHFAGQNVDWAVIEVGIGGRLDSTNVIAPRGCLITALSLDHHEFLGNTLAEIAAEKAGIIKPGVPVVCHAQPAEAMTVIEGVAREQRAPLTWLGRHWRWATLAGLQNRDSSIANTVSTLRPHTSTVAQSFEVKQVAFKRSEQTPYPNNLEGIYDIPLLGKHQLDNATGVIALLDALRRDEANRLTVNSAAVHNGLHNVRWPGRFEVLRSDPPLVLDGAHNVDSVNKLAVALSEVFLGHRWTMIFACFVDKNAAGMMKALAPRVSRWLFAPLEVARAAPATQLAEQARALGLRNIEVLSDMAGAVAHARAAREPVCVTGSLSLVAAFRQRWPELNVEPD